MNEQIVAESTRDGTQPAIVTTPVRRDGPWAVHTACRLSPGCRSCRSCRSCRTTVRPLSDMPLSDCRTTVGITVGSLSELSVWHHAPVLSDLLSDCRTLSGLTADSVNKCLVDGQDCVPSV